MKIKKILPATGSRVVCLITVAKDASWNTVPRYSEWDSSYIQSVLPCIQNGNRFENLRTGEAVIPAEDCLIWGVLVGTCLHYEDGYELLVSRTIEKKPKLAICDEVSFNPISMVRHEVFTRNDDDI